MPCRACPTWSRRCLLLRYPHLILSVPPAQDGMEVVEPFKAGSSSYGNSRAIKDKSKDVEVASTSTTIVNDNVTGALASPPFDCNKHFETTAWCGRR